MKFEHSRNCIWLNNEKGDRIAEIDFPEIRPGTVNIVHTQVDQTLQGQGIAGQLMESLVKQLRTEHRKAELTCSYAVKWVSSHPEAEDILENPEEERKRAARMQGAACGLHRI